MKKQQLNSAIIRQGDVLLVRRSAAPEQAPASKPVVLALGEVTGHKHQFLARSRAGVVDEGMLAVSETVMLRHDEHTHIEVPPGLYDLPVQVEHTDQDEPHVVCD